MVSEGGDNLPTGAGEISFIGNRGSRSRSSKTPADLLCEHEDMQLISEPAHAIDLRATPVHLGLGSRAMPIDGSAWDPDVLAAYGAATAGDGDEGRMVMIFPSTIGSWTHWERHPGGEEVVVCLSGRMTVRR